MVFSKLLARKAVVYLVNNIQSGVDILKNNIDKISGTATFESLYVPEIT
jgi:hypothetical protein